MKIKESEKVEFLLRYIGDEAFDILSDSYGTEDLYVIEYGALKAKLSEQHAPKKLENKCFVFNCRQQLPGESVQNFANALSIRRYKLH